MSLALTRISFQNFRSYKSLELGDLGSLTIFVGPNAIGKTNIVEGIQLMTALTSFRHPKIEQLILSSQPFARVEADVTDGNRQLSYVMTLEGHTRKYSLNGKNKRPVDLKGTVPSVTFTPDDLDLVKGPMGGRRTALDVLGSQLSPNHYLIKKDYEKVIQHKNRLLKEEASVDLIASINETLITCGAQLLCYRVALFEKLSSAMKSHYRSIVDGREELEVKYIPSWAVDTTNLSRDEARISLAEALNDLLSEERARRHAVIGPHADRIEFYIDGKDAQAYASQGQQRSIVLAWKLAEVTCVNEVLHQQPILLLDDVMSELDANRRSSLVSFISGDIQTFITTTNLDYFDDSLLNEARVIRLPLEDESGVQL